MAESNIQLVNPPGGGSGAAPGASGATVYTLGEVVPPGAVLAEGLYYADHCPKRFLVTRAKIARAVDGGDTLRAQVTVAGEELFPGGPVTLDGEVTTVEAASIGDAFKNTTGVPEDARIEIDIDKEESYGGGSSYGLTVFLWGSWVES